MALQNNLTQLPGQWVPATQNFTQNLNTELPQNNTVPECKALKISKPIWKAITDRIPELLAPYAKICRDMPSIELPNFSISLARPPLRHWTCRVALWARWSDDSDGRSPLRAAPLYSEPREPNVFRAPICIAIILQGVTSLTKCTMMIHDSHVNIWFSNICFARIASTHALFWIWCGRSCNISMSFRDSLLSLLLDKLILVCSQRINFLLQRANVFWQICKTPRHVARGQTCTKLQGPKVLWDTQPGVCLGTFRGCTCC